MSYICTDAIEKYINLTIFQYLFVAIGRVVVEMTK